MTRFIFVAGGVISGVGKGVATASLGKIMKSMATTPRSLKLTLILIMMPAPCVQPNTVKCG